jgi:hypothetical protein
MEGLPNLAGVVGVNPRDYPSLLHQRIPSEQQVWSSPDEARRILDKLEFCHNPQAWKLVEYGWD